jgi:hypothetical protein
MDSKVDVECMCLPSVLPGQRTAPFLVSDTNARLRLPSAPSAFVTLALHALFQALGERSLVHILSLKASSMLVDLSVSPVSRVCVRASRVDDPSRLTLFVLPAVPRGCSCSHLVTKTLAKL